MYYANRRGFPLSVSAGDVVFVFAPGSYYPVVAALLTAYNSGLLELVPDSYPTENPTAALATAQSLYTSSLADIAQVHIHNRELWLGLRAAPDATHRGSPDSIDPFVVTSGDREYGAVTHILGSADTPIQVGKTKFDPRRIVVVGTTEVSTYKLRFLWGIATPETALSSGSFTEVVIYPHAGQIVEVWFPRLDVGNSIWVQTWSVALDNTISFLLGIHEYSS